MEFDQIFNKNLKFKTYIATLSIAVLYAAFGTWYIILAMQFEGAYMLHLAGSVGIATLFALIADFFLYDFFSRNIKKFATTQEDPGKAYAESMKFPLRYAFSCMTSYYSVVFVVMIYMAIATDITLRGIFNILIGGFIVATPGGMTIYFSTQHFFDPVIKFLFKKSGINSFTDRNEIKYRSNRLKIFVVFLIVSSNAFVGIGAFFLYTLVNIGLPPEIYYNVLWKVFAISGFNLFITFVAAYFFGKFLATPMKNLETNIQRIADAQGDLTQKATITSNDEIGLTAGWFNYFIQNMQKLVIEITTASDHVTEIAENLSASTEEINASSQEVTSTIGNISEGAMSQLTKVQTVVGLTENIELYAENVLDATKTGERIIEEVVESALQGKDKAESAVQSITTLAGEIESSVEAIRELSKKVEQVANIAETIQGISVQTNLLALNAAIESARVGEFGAGFAVIANEIRNLNEDTNNAAQEITKLIFDVQNSTTSVISKIKVVSEQVNVGKDTIATSNHILQQIAFSVSDAEKAIKDITKLAESQKNSLKQVVSLVDETASIAESNAGATEEVSASSEEQMSSVEDMANAAQELSENAFKLRELMTKFNI